MFQKTVLPQSSPFSGVFLGTLFKFAQLTFLSRFRKLVRSQNSLEGYQRKLSQSSFASGWRESSSPQEISQRRDSVKFLADLS